MKGNLASFGLYDGRLQVANSSKGNMGQLCDAGKEERQGEREEEKDDRREKRIEEKRIRENTSSILIL